MWNSQHTGVQPTQSQKIYGRFDVWGGVRDYAVLGDDHWNVGRLYPEREPLLGFYDMMQQSVVDQHILQASSRGLDYFAFYWYWNKDTNKEDTASAGAHTFLTSAYKNKIKFLVSPILLGRATTTIAMWRDSIVPYMVNTYLGDSSYMKTSDGRPVIVDFDLGFKSSADHAQAIQILREAVIAKTGKNPQILFVAQSVHTSSQLSYAVTNLKLDGVTCFNFRTGAAGGEPYSTTISGWSAAIAAQSSHVSLYYPCAGTGNDARPWYMLGWGPWWSPTGVYGVNDRPYNTGMTADVFETHLRDLKTYIDRNPVKTGKTLTIYAWNEWGEGGIIEPSKMYGYDYLDRIQKVFGLVAR